MKIGIEYWRGKSGNYFARSPDERGLLVVEPTLPRLFAAIPFALNDLRNVRGQSPCIFEIECKPVEARPWEQI